MEVRPTNYGAVVSGAGAARLQQRIYINNAIPKEYIRTWNGNTWGSWYEVVMQAVTSS